MIYCYFLLWKKKENGEAGTRKLALFNRKGRQSHRKGTEGENCTKASRLWGLMFLVDPELFR